MPWVWPMTKGTANLSSPLETTTSTSVRDSTRSPAAGSVAITLPSGISWLFWRTTRTSSPDSWMEEKASVSHLPTTSGMADHHHTGLRLRGLQQATRPPSSGRPGQQVTRTLPQPNGRGTDRRVLHGGVIGLGKHPSSAPSRSRPGPWRDRSRPAHHHPVRER